MANHQSWSMQVINGVRRSTQDDSESLWHAIRRRIRPLAFGSTGPTASGKLVVDRTDTGGEFWGSALPPHTLENAGSSDLRVITVELKHPGAALFEC